MNKHEKTNKLPIIKNNNYLSKTLFKGKKKMEIDFNPITNCFSTKKMSSNLKLKTIEEDNNNNRYDSGSILPKKRKKYSYLSTSNSFKKRNDKKRIKEEKGKEIKLKLEEEDDNIHDPIKYSKHLMDNLNNKLFLNIFTTDFFKQSKDKEIMEQDFEDEVRKYQLLQIMELNKRIREGQAIKSINDVKELYNMSNKNTNIYSRYFQIKEKEEKKKKKFRNERSKIEKY